MTDPDLCCDIRKTEPLQRALAGFGAWFTGRKRFQAATRADAAASSRPTATRIKVNPLASWSAADLDGLHAPATTCPSIRWSPRAIPSIGCVPCTTPCCRARTSAPAAGAASTRPSAASTSPLETDGSGI